MKTVLIHKNEHGNSNATADPAVVTAVPHHRNYAARMGRWSADHWKTATFGWLALVLLAFAIGSQVGTKQADPTRAGPGESGRSC